MAMDSHLREVLRLGRIGYLNVLPVYYPLETGKVPHSFEIVSGIPSHLNELMAQGELDLSPVSSIEYARHPERYFILPHLSISSRSKHEGEVQSVLLLSRQPIDRLDGETIWVSTQSHTSVALLKALFALYLEKQVHFKPAACSQAIEGGDHPAAFLAIGNEALQLRQHPLYPYHWDLGKAWFDWTGLPFVFALWVIQRKAVERGNGRLDPAVRGLLSAKEWGLSHLDEICTQAAGEGILGIPKLHDYYDHLGYDLQTEEQRSLALFYSCLHRVGEVNAVPELHLYSPTVCPVREEPAARPTELRAEW